MNETKIRQGLIVSGSLLVQNGVRLSDLYVNSVNGFVGIGTDNPFGHLHVASSGTSIKISSTNTYARLDISSQNNQYYFQVEDDTFDGIGLYQVTGTAGFKMILNTAGNVGIGTTSPSQKLAVVGAVSASTYYGDGSNLTGISAGGVTINNNTNDYLVTATGTANTINGESNLRFNGTVLSATGSIAIKGSDTSGTTKNFHVQTGNGTSIMDFRNETYAFFGCGQGGGNASGFIFRYRSPSYTQFCGYTYGNGSSPSYQPIYMDTDQVGRGQGIYINYTTGSAPASTEFAVKGRGSTSGTYNARFQNSNSNELLTIRDDGSVGIGTNSPSRPFEIQSTGTQGTQMQISSVGANYAGIKFVPSTGDNWELQAGTNNAFFLYNRTDGLYRWLMDGSGNFGIGTTSPTAKVHIVGTGTTVSTTALYVANSSNNFIFSVQDNGTVRAANDIIAFYSSDKNLKTNIQPLSNPIEKIKQIGGYEFDWKPESDHTGHDVGVIAQEIESILPEVVTTRDNGYKAVRYEKIVPLLIEAIKEQQKQIDELKALLK